MNAVFLTVKESINTFCYFCGYYKTLEKHHIVPRSEGGNNDSNNFLVLCPNCHSLIHKKNYYLQWKDGHYFMVNFKEKDIIFPISKVIGIHLDYPKDMCNKFVDR